MTQDLRVDLCRSKFAAHLARGQKLLDAKRAEERAVVAMQRARQTIASLAPTAAAAAPSSALPPIAASRPAPTSAAPVRLKLTPAQWDERISKVVKSPLAAGREQLAVMLCSSDCSIEAALE